MYGPSNDLYWINYLKDYVSKELDEKSDSKCSSIDPSTTWIMKSILTFLECGLSW